MNTNSLRVRNENNAAVALRLDFFSFFFMGCFYLMVTLSSSAAAAAAAAARVQSWVAAGRGEHLRRVSQVTPSYCQHGVPLLVDNFPFDFGAQVQIADQGDSV